MKASPPLARAVSRQTETYVGPNGALLWSQDDCHDCSGCVAACPFAALEIRDGLVIADMERCTLCTICDRMCPTAAITIERAPRATG